MGRGRKAKRNGKGAAEMDKRAVGGSPRETERDARLGGKANKGRAAGRGSAPLCAEPTVIRKGKDDACGRGAREVGVAVGKEMSWSGGIAPG